MRYARDFADRRRVTDDKKDMNRLYVGREHADAHGREGRPPVPASAFGDRRVRARAGAASAGGVAICRRVLASRIPQADKWVTAVAKDLQAHRGSPSSCAGEYQPAALHQLAQRSTRRRNVDVTVTYIPTIEIRPTDRCASLRELAHGDGRRAGRRCW